MTFRTKPAVKRTHRPNWEADARRTLYLNLAFGGLVVLAVVILGGAAAASYYGDHLAAAATVNGVGISKDAVNERIAIDKFRIDEQERRMQTLVAQGRMTADDAGTQRQQLEQSRTSISSGALDEMIDEELQTQLAKTQGITISDQQVSDQLKKEATTVGAIHAWEIAIKPATTGTNPATADQKALARTTADYVLRVLKNGGDFAKIATAQSSDPTASKGGDLGFVSVGDTSLDAPFEKALFALPENGMTDIVVGDDGTYRIGKVTKIVSEVSDQGYQDRITTAGVNLDAYKRVLRASLAQTALKDKITAGLVDQATVQRHVLQIKLDLSQSQTGTGDEVKARHILFSPNHDPQNASSLPVTDPAWAKAKADAEAAYQKLLSDPSAFQDMAKALSDDKSTGAQGGDLPYETKDALTPEFAKAIFAGGLKPNQILAPVKTPYGWHVIQFIASRKTAGARIQDLSSLLGTGTGQNAADFATEAKQGDGPEAAKGGDIGWVAHYQVAKELEDPIFSTPVGHVSSVVKASDGWYLFKILAEETRKPDVGAQTDTLKSKGFDNWYQVEKAKASIQRDPNYVPPSA